MKKSFLFSLLTVFALAFTINTSTADDAKVNTQTDNTAMVEDCKTVGNVSVEIVYQYSSDKLYAKATNYNNFDVEISYKIMCTDGIRTYPVDSGRLWISRKTNNTACSACGPSIPYDSNKSYYLELNRPLMCE